MKRPLKVWKHLYRLSLVKYLIVLVSLPRRQKDMSQNAFKSLQNRDKRLCLSTSKIGSCKIAQKTFPLCLVILFASLRHHKKYEIEHYTQFGTFFCLARIIAKKGQCHQRQRPPLIAISLNRNMIYAPCVDPRSCSHSLQLIEMTSRNWGHTRAHSEETYKLS